jgi:hypothetical protein
MVSLYSLSEQGDVSMKNLAYEVVVLGGGIAGALAAVASARTGAKTLVVEETGCLGGTLTNAGTGPMMTFHAGDKQVIRGLGEELIARMKAKHLSPGHTVDSTGYTYTVTPFDSEGMKRELELMTLEAGVTLLYHASLVSVSVAKKRATSLEVVSGGNLLSIKGSVFIDASGDGVLLYKAGVSTVSGRESDGKNQPMTMNLKVSGVDIKEIRSLMERDLTYFPTLAQHPKGREKQALRLSFSGFTPIVRKAIEDGELTIDRNVVLCFETNTPGEVIVNMTRVNGLDPLDPLDLSLAEIEGRRQAWEVFAFLKKHIPGFSNSVFLNTASRIGVRSSRRMVGVYTLTVDDIISERKFEDAISCNGYPVDIHSSDDAYSKTVFMRKGGYYTIPYRCLVNREIPNILAAGRDISCTFDAHASLRVSPSCSALGQAAGTAAALAVKNGVNPLDLDVSELQECLLVSDAVLE